MGEDIRVTQGLLLRTIGFCGGGSLECSNNEGVKLLKMKGGTHKIAGVSERRSGKKVGVRGD